MKLFLTTLLLFIGLVGYAQKYPKPDVFPYKTTYEFSEDYQKKLEQSPDGLFLVTFLTTADIYYFLLQDSVGFYDAEMGQGSMLIKKTDKLDWWVEKNVMVFRTFDPQGNEVRRNWVPQGNLIFRSDDGDVWMKLEKTKRRKKKKNEQN